ncbi:hypothetical protein C0585_01385 [Candidatus Woesearchaeota archaeon]|nr:MAG: hypothetical protein C0585_01385 [Candidatus Woesearchaeota archaeon]
MIDFIKEFWNSFDVNLRKGYLIFFILAFTVMPFAKYLTEINISCMNNTCTYNDQLFMNNLIIAFALYVFIMMIIILGHVMKFMMVGNKESKTDSYDKTSNSA